MLPACFPVRPSSRPKAGPTRRYEEFPTSVLGIVYAYYVPTTEDKNFLLRSFNMLSTFQPITSPSLNLLTSVSHRLDQKVVPAEKTPAQTRVNVWGVPFAPLTTDQTLDAVDALIASKQPHYFITANLNYVMFSAENPELQQVNEEAAFIVADGMPMVWASRRLDTPLPERVTGADLVVSLSERASQNKRRLFLLGGQPAVTRKAADILKKRYPGLQIVGIETPDMNKLSPAENDALIKRIQQAKPDLLFAALGQPKGEFWLHKHYRTLGVPAAVQIGGSLNFVAGAVKRAPKWIQRSGLEWSYRIWREPTRLAFRYWQNIRFLGRQLFNERLATQTKRNP